MTVKRWVVMSVCAAAFAAPGRCVGRWGEDGHRIVGQIAYEHLSDAARREVDRLLALESTSLPEACYWADAVARRQPEYRFANRLHYANVPRGVESYDPARDRPPEGDVVSAIPRYAAVLADRSRPDSERLEALRFLGHFVGDLHQPLHVGYADDKGGNDTRVVLCGRPTNLHSAWDTGILREWESQSGAEWGELARSLEGRICRCDVTIWGAQMDPQEWARESFALVRSEVYPGITPGVKLGPEFVEEKMPIVKHRLSQGGVRLAEMLNRALDEPRARHPIGPSRHPLPTAFAQSSRKLRCAAIMPGAAGG